MAFTDNYIYCIKMYIHIDASIEVIILSGDVSVDGLAQFHCSVTGVNVYNFTWLHNRKLQTNTIQPLTIITHDGNNSSLEIHEIPLEKVGNYTCIAYSVDTSTPLQQSIILSLRGILRTD